MRSDQSERHIPPAPIGTPEHSSRQGSQIKILCAPLRHVWARTPSCYIIQEALFFLLHFSISLICLWPSCNFDLEGWGPRRGWGVVSRTYRFPTVPLCSSWTTSPSNVAQVKHAWVIRNVKSTIENSKNTATVDQECQHERNFKNRVWQGGGETYPKGNGGGRLYGHVRKQGLSLRDLWHFECCQSWRHQNRQKNRSPFLNYYPCSKQFANGYILKTHPIVNKAFHNFGEKWKV